MSGLIMDFQLRNSILLSLYQWWKLTGMKRELTDYLTKLTNLQDFQDRHWNEMFQTESKLLCQK
jgi:hypothetical protein